MKRYVVVALTEDGEELERVTVVADKLEKAKTVLGAFADWLDVFEVLDDGSLRKVSAS